MKRVWSRSASRIARNVLRSRVGKTGTGFAAATAHVSR